MANAFGQYFETARLRQGKTLRQFCRENGFDASNISRLERGLAPPPRSTVKLMRFIDALGLEPKAWVEFSDLAAVAAQRIPARFLQNDELVKRLPALLTTIHGKRLSGKRLDALIELIRIV